MLKEVLLVCILTIFTESLIKLKYIYIELVPTNNRSHVGKFKYSVIANLHNYQNNKDYFPNFSKKFHKVGVSLNKIGTVEFVVSYLDDNHVPSSKPFIMENIPNLVLMRSGLQPAFGEEGFKLSYQSRADIGIDSSINNDVDEPYELYFEGLDPDLDGDRYNLTIKFKLQLKPSNNIILN